MGRTVEMGEKKRNRYPFPPSSVASLVPRDLPFYSTEIPHRYPAVAKVVKLTMASAEELVSPDSHLASPSIHHYWAATVEAAALKIVLVRVLVSPDSRPSSDGACVPEGRNEGRDFC